MDANRRLSRGKEERSLINTNRRGGGRGSPTVVHSIGTKGSGCQMECRERVENVEAGKLTPELLCCPCKRWWYYCECKTAPHDGNFKGFFLGGGVLLQPTNCRPEA